MMSLLGLGRWKLIALGALAFCLALFGVRASIIRNALAREEAKRANALLREAEERRKNREEIRRMSDDELLRELTGGLR